MRGFGFGRGFAAGGAVTEGGAATEGGAGEGMAEVDPELGAGILAEIETGFG